MCHGSQKLFCLFILTAHHESTLQMWYEGGLILGRYCGQGGEWVPASLTGPPPPRVGVGHKQCLP